MGVACTNFKPHLFENWSETSAQPCISVLDSDPDPDLDLDPDPGPDRDLDPYPYPDPDPEQI